jgi:hypothetical protein
MGIITDSISVLGEKGQIPLSIELGILDIEKSNASIDSLYQVSERLLHKVFGSTPKNLANSD